MTTLPTIGDSLKVAKPPEQPKPVTLPQATAALPGMRMGITKSPFLKLFLFGPGGAGKTVFAATAPKPFFIDCENSTEALLDWPELLAESKIIHMDRWTEAGVDGLMKGLRDTNHDWADRETIVVDTGDALQRVNLEFILANSGRDKFLPMEHDYKKSGEMLRRFILDIRNLPKHVIVLAHSEETIVKETGQRIMRTGVTPKLAKTLREEFGLFGFMYPEERKWEEPFVNVIQTRANPMIEAKSRYRHLPPVIKNPTFNDILKSINKEQVK